MNSACDSQTLFNRVKERCVCGLLCLHLHSVTEPDEHLVIFIISEQLFLGNNATSLIPIKVTRCRLAP